MPNLVSSVEVIMRYGLVCVAIGAAMTFANVAALSAQVSEPQGRSTVLNVDVQARRRILDIYNKEGLHAAAEANGGELVLPHDLSQAWRNHPRTLDHMIGPNTLVVRGTVQSVMTTPGTNDQMIYTLYELAVAETLQGAPQASLVMMLPGGRFTYPDGVVGELRTGAETLVPGASCFLFVREIQSDFLERFQGLVPSIHTLVAGLDSFYHISSGRVRSLTPKPTELSARYNQSALELFLADVRAAIAAAESRGR